MVRIRLQDRSLIVRWFNAAIEPKRGRVKRGRGWTPVILDSVSHLDRIAIGGYGVSSNGAITRRRGRDREVLMAIRRP